MHQFIIHINNVYNMDIVWDNYKVVVKLDHKIVMKLLINNIVI